MMAVRQRPTDPFDIHEDARTEETEMMVEDDLEQGAEKCATQQTPEPEDEEVDAEEGEEEAEDDEDDVSSEDEPVDRGVQADMDKLQSDFPGFADKYRLIKRIGEGLSAYQRSLSNAC